VPQFSQPMDINEYGSWPCVCEDKLTCMYSADHVASTEAIKPRGLKRLINEDEPCAKLLWAYTILPLPFPVLLF